MKNLTPELLKKLGAKKVTEANDPALITLQEHIARHVSHFVSKIDKASKTASKSKTMFKQKNRHKPVFFLFLHLLWCFNTK